VTASAQFRCRAVGHAEHPDARVRNVFRQLRSFWLAANLAGDGLRNLMTTS
jgi:hypothetical protein